MKPYFPLGKIIVVQGDPGIGKSALLLTIAAYITTGTPLPMSESDPIMGNVIYQNAEDGAGDTIKPRLLSAKADCDKIAFIEATSLNIDEDCSILDKYVKETNAKLLVLDPAQAFIGPKADMCRATDIRRLMSGLAKIAADNMCAVVIVAHMNKSTGTKDLYRALGSIDITAAARSVLQVGRDKDGVTRFVRHLKSSLAPEGVPFAFRIGENSVVEFLGEYDCDIEVDDTEEAEPTAEVGKRHRAAKIILDLLSDGPKRSTEITDACNEEDISTVTAKRVKAYLGIKSLKRQNEWFWTI